MSVSRLQHVYNTYTTQPYHIQKTSTTRLVSSLTGEGEGDGGARARGVFHSCTRPYRVHNTSITRPCCVHSTSITRPCYVRTSISRPGYVHNTDVMAGEDKGGGGARARGVAPQERGRAARPAPPLTSDCLVRFTTRPFCVHTSVSRPYQVRLMSVSRP